MRITASKAKKFQEVLRMVHPKVADLGRLVVSRTSSATSMTSLALRVMTLLQRLADANPEEADQIIDQQRNSVLQVADWAAATGNEWKPFMTLDELYRQAEMWHDSFTPEEDDDYVAEDPIEMDFADGWYIVRLLAENAEAEGNLMGHCVGGYEADIANGSKIVYSLRDPNNRPHVTFNTYFELDEEAIAQDAEAGADQHFKDMQEELLPQILENAGDEAEYEAENEFETYNHPNDSEFEDENGEPDEELYERARRKFIQKKRDRAEEVAKKDFEDEWSYRGRQEWIETKKWELSHYEKADYMAEKMEQIQGKEDNPPINRYRKYLRDFVNRHMRHVDIDEVKGRLRDVDEMIELLIANPERNAHWLTSGDVREQDIAPYFEMQISTPQDLPASVMGRIMLYAVKMMERTEDPRYRQYVLAALNMPNGSKAVRTISSGGYDPIMKLGEEGMRWVAQRLRDATTEEEVIDLLGDSSKWPKHMLRKKEWSEATQEKLRRLLLEKQQRFEDETADGDPSTNKEFMEDYTAPTVEFMVRNIDSRILRGGQIDSEALQRFRDLLALLRRREEWVLNSVEQKDNWFMYWSKQLGWLSSSTPRLFEEVLAKIYHADRDVFLQVASEMPRQLMTHIRRDFANAHPQMNSMYQALAVPVKENQYMFGEERLESDRARRGKRPEDLIAYPSNDLFEDAITRDLDAAEGMRPKPVPEQPQLDFAARRSVLKLASLLEEVMPQAADFLERKALSEV